MTCLTLLAWAQQEATEEQPFGHLILYLLLLHFHSDPPRRPATDSMRISMPVILCIILGALLCLVLAILAGQIRSARAQQRGGSLRTCMKCLLDIGGECLVGWGGWGDG